MSENTLYRVEFTDDKSPSVWRKVWALRPIEDYDQGWPPKLGAYVKALRGCTHEDALVTDIRRQ